MRRTKIICTLGPACRDEDTLKSMLKAGMNVARLNFSHQDHDFHKSNIATLKKLRGELGRPLALLLDTKGPEIRTGVLENDSVTLKKGNRVTLTSRIILGDEKNISVSCPDICKVLKPDDIILIDDGKIRLSVENTQNGDIKCKIIAGGVLGNTRGINIPSVTIPMPFLSEKDKSDILLGISEGIDYIAASFVRNADDIRVLRAFLLNNGGSDIKIIAKIECRQAIINFDEILKLSDGIMVARGDLGVEVPFEGLPGIQKRLITRCFRSGKMAVTATEMLESMIKNEFPTRAEISDVANAVFDRSSAVMLSGETAIGNSPANVVKTMSKICEKAGKDVKELDPQIAKIYPETLGSGTDAVCQAAVTASGNLGAEAIIVLTSSGKCARLLAKYRPDIPIIAITDNPRTYHSLSANWGIEPILSEKLDLNPESIKNITRKLISSEKPLIIVNGYTLKIL